MPSGEALMAVLFVALLWYGGTEAVRGVKWIGHEAKAGVAQIGHVLHHRHPQP